MDTPQDPPPDGTGARRRASSADDQIVLVDLLLTLSRGRGLIVLSILAFGLLGLLYAASVPSEYTATSKVVREAGPDGDNQGLPQGPPSVQGLGLDLGGGSAGLTPASYPEIATSREVRLAVVRDTFSFPGTGRRTTFVEHVNRPAGVLDQTLRYTLRLPWTIADTIGSLFGGTETPPPGGSDSTNTLIYPTEAEERAIAALRNRISASYAESGALEASGGLMTITTTATDPTLAARMNERVIEHLRTRVREIRTETTRENLAFIQERFEEAQHELDVAEDRLSQFLEQNRSVLTGGNEPQLEFRRERLRREVRFKEQLYSQLQEQVTQTRLQLQREQPVVTIAEKPAPPTAPSAPDWSFTIILSLVLGGLVGITGAFLRGAFRRQGDSEATQKKMHEVRTAFRPAGLLRGVRKELRMRDRK